MSNTICRLEPDTILQVRLLRCAKYGSLFVLLIALLVLIGWQWNIAFLKRPIPHLTAMNPLTALTLLLSVCSFLLLFSADHSRKLILAGNIFAAIVLLTGLIRLTGTIPGFHISIDHILFSRSLQSDSTGNLSNQMTLSTACCFLLSGTALLLLNTETDRKRMPAQYMALATIIMATFSIVGYLYRVQAFYGPFTYIPMALHTAVCFLLISIAILFANPDKGFMREFTSLYTGSLMARTSIPLAIISPIILGYLRLYAYWDGLFSTEFGVTLLVLSIIGIFITIIWYNTHLLNRRDALRRSTQQALLESEERFRMLVSSVKDYAIFMLNPDGLVLSWNEGAEQIKGYKAEEIIGKHISCFYTAEEVKNGEPAYNLSRAREQGRFEREGWRIRKDGSQFWADVIITAIHDTSGRVLGFAKVTRDITESKKLAEQIRQFNITEQKKTEKKITDYKYALDQSSIVAITDQKGIIKHVNDNFCKISKYPADQLIGKDHRIINSGYHPASFIRDLWVTIANGRIWKGEICNKAKDGTIYWVDTTIIPFLNEEGKPIEYLAIRADITERKQAEERLQQSLYDIRQLASHLQNVREEERAGIAREIHDELGQQLTGLKMDLSWIAKRIPPQGNSQINEKIKTTTELLDITIKTVRRIATQLRPSILDDLGLIAAIEWQSQEFQKRSGITTQFNSSILEFHTSSNIAIGLFRICQESLTNIARHAGASRVCITLQEQNDRLILLKIEDNGRGFQYNKAGSKKTLGLLGMKERTLMMDGSFEIISMPGKGTTLFVTVPLTINTA